MSFLRKNKNDINHKTAFAHDFANDALGQERLIHRDPLPALLQALAFMANLFYFKRLTYLAESKDSLKSNAIMRRGLTAMTRRVILCAELDAMRHKIEFLAITRCLRT
jgi:hypothetical protein